MLWAGLAAACGESFTAIDSTAETDGGGNSSSVGGRGGTAGKASDASIGSGGTAGSGAGGSAGSGLGGSAGSGVGGSAGSGVGGSAGSGVGGTAGSATGGSAGSATGGSAGSGGASGKGGSAGLGKGGTGGSATGGSAGSTLGAGGSASGQGGVGGSAGSKGTGGTSGGSSDAGQCALCNPTTCARLRWTFDSGTLEGVTCTHPAAVRSFMASPALAIDVVELNTISDLEIVLPICLSGAIDLRPATFSFRVYFEGLPASSGEFYVQASAPAPQGNAYLGAIAPGTGAWNSFSAPMSMSAFSSSVGKVTIQVGSTGAPFGGTIWFDDFKIQ
jgi:hypothetical protein